MRKRGAIDIGNTRIKTAVFDENGELLETAVFKDKESVVAWLTDRDCDSAMLASVYGTEALVSDKMRIHTLSSKSILPFQNLYESKETLGTDRIAAMAAAASLFRDKAVLVFDTGTCMTIDFLEPGNIYRGGNISPGIDMRLKAMHTMTGSLPLSFRDKAKEGLGTDTLSALASGVISGMRYEMEGYMKRYSAQFPGLQIILCGGDQSHFDKPFEFKIFAAPNFVLQGLYHLLLLNDK